MASPLFCLWIWRFRVPFFYLLKKVQLLFGSAVGVSALPGYPFLGEQGAGALLALLAVACWHARKHFADVWAQVIRPERAASRAEAISHRSAVITLGICLLLLAVFCVRSGMTLWAFAIFIGGLFNDCGGFNPNACGIGTTDPCDWVSNTAVYDNFTPRHATFAGGQPNNALVDELVERCKFMPPFGPHPMPDQLEAFKLGERTGIRNRTMFGVLVIASLVGILSSLILYPYAIYSEGVAAGSEQIHAGGADTYNFPFFVVSESKNRRIGWRPRCSDSPSLRMWGIIFLRSRFVWLSVASRRICYRRCAGDKRMSSGFRCFWRW